jgi:helicase
VAPSRQDFTLFLHSKNSDFFVSGIHNDEKLFQSILEIKSTKAGPRPLRFRVKGRTKEQLRRPEDFIDLGRKAKKIRISSQTKKEKRDEIKSLLSSYGLQAEVVRTCHYCSSSGDFSPLVDSNVIVSYPHEICLPCALSELETEYSPTGIWTKATKNHIQKILLDFQDIGHVKKAFSGELDPHLTTFDQVTSEQPSIPSIDIKEIDIHEDLRKSLLNRFETLQPIQNLSLQNGLLTETDQLIVSSTGTGKTLIGEIAGINRALNGNGKFLFLVPLVALANQKYANFKEHYGDLLDISLRVGSSRVRGDSYPFNPNSDVIIGTYEGMDHALRTHKNISNVGTVVIDEIHMVADHSRGHCIDGLIARLKHHCKHFSTKTQWIYLSATVGNPNHLASDLNAIPLEFNTRTIPLHRHIAFSLPGQKYQMINELVQREFMNKSSKGYRGQTIIFTNSRQRCHDISNKLTSSSAPYHAGLDHHQRKKVEQRFSEGKIASVVTTAALSAGVDFPASQVVFDSLAMGTNWLNTQEFQQMQGRAGRPSYHDTGLIYLLVEPGKVYSRTMRRTEDQVAFELLTSDVENVHLSYDEQAALSETLANVVVAPQHTSQLNSSMIGEIQTKMSIQNLVKLGLVSNNRATPIGKIICQNFFTTKEATAIMDALNKHKSPSDIVAMIELMRVEN